MDIRNRIIKTGLVDIEELTPFQGKLKTLDDKNFNKLRKSIADEGFSFTVHVWENGGKTYIIDGHQRVSVLVQMRKQGIKVPPITCAFVSAETYRDAKKLVLLAISQYGKIQKDGFLEFVDGEDFDFGDYDFPDLSFDLDELFEVKAQSDFDESKEDDIPDDAPSRVQPGDIWQLGDHRLMCGDSSDKQSVLTLMNGKKANLVHTDPPYNIASDSKNYAADVSKSMNDLANAEWDKNFDVVPCLKNIMEVCAESVTIYVWTSHFLIQKIWDTFEDWSDCLSYCVWNKPNPMPSLSKRHWTWNTELCVYVTRGSKRTVNFPKEGHATSVWTFNKKSDGTHPTQKPIELCEHPIKFSSKEGDLVLDLFLGSGSTLIACEKTGRKCFGMELDPHYCDIIITRWETLTGKRAERISCGR